MTNYQVISQERHAGKRWHRFKTYAHAANDMVAALVAQELPKALLSLPIGFVEQDANYLPVAILGLAPGENLFTNPDGNWGDSYIPAIYRSYPYRLADAEDGQQVLVIDEDSGLVSDGSEGEAFFDNEGLPTKPLQDIFGFLSSIESSRQFTVRACAALKKYELVKPWPITIQGVSGDQRLAGLYRVEEADLGRLSPEALHELMQSGGMAIAYCQLLSTQNLPRLGQLAQARNGVMRHGSLSGSNGELDLEFLNQGGTISFGNLF